MSVSTYPRRNKALWSRIDLRTTGLVALLVLSLVLLGYVMELALLPAERLR
jgi:hypothetical protein